MAKYRYYSHEGLRIADYSEVDPSSITISENSSLVSITDQEDDGLDVVIHLAPGERLERIED